MWDDLETPGYTAEVEILLGELLTYGHHAGQDDEPYWAEDATPFRKIVDRYVPMLGPSALAELEPMIVEVIERTAYPHTPRWTGGEDRWEQSAAMLLLGFWELYPDATVPVLTRLIQRVSTRRVVLEVMADVDNLIAVDELYRELQPHLAALVAEAERLADDDLYLLGAGLSQTSRANPPAVGHARSVLAELRKRPHFPQSMVEELLEFT